MTGLAAAKVAVRCTHTTSQQGDKAQHEVWVVIVIGQLTGLNEWPDSIYYYKAAHASPGVCWTLTVPGMIVKVSATHYTTLHRPRHAKTTVHK
jgi:hypothetical protein